MTGQIALITGVSRRQGLGFATARALGARGYRVYLTARQKAAADVLASELRVEGIDVTAASLDVADNDSIRDIGRLLADEGRLDVLVNNAAGAFDMHRPTLELSRDELMSAFDIHVAGPLVLVETLLPLLKVAPAGRIVNVSTEAGSFGNAYGMAQRGPMLGAYGVTKAALNALTVKLAVALGDTRIKVNSVCPGWVATYPGTAEMGARPVEDGAAGIVWAATLPADGPSGGFFRDGAPLAW